MRVRVLTRENKFFPDSSHPLQRRFLRHGRSEITCRGPVSQHEPTETDRIPTRLASHRGPPGRLDDGAGGRKWCFLSRLVRRPRPQQKTMARAGPHNPRPAHRRYAIRPRNESRFHQPSCSCSCSCIGEAIKHGKEVLPLVTNHEPHQSKGSGLKGQGPSCLVTGRLVAGTTRGPRNLTCYSVSVSQAEIVSPQYDVSAGRPKR